MCVHWSIALYLSLHCTLHVSVSDAENHSKQTTSLTDMKSICFLSSGKRGRERTVRGEREMKTLALLLNAYQRSSNTSHTHSHITFTWHQFHDHITSHSHANYLTIKISHGAEASVKQYMFFMICVICPVCICPVCRDTPGQKAIVPASRPGLPGQFFVSRRNPIPSSYRPVFFGFSKKNFSNFFSKNGSKIRSFFNNSWILIKIDFYCCFSILNMILLSKMTFCHFAKIENWPKLTFL